MTVTDWLLDSDPAIRWQVQRDLVRTPAEPVEHAAGAARAALVRGLIAATWTTPPIRHVPRAWG